MDSKVEMSEEKQLSAEADIKKIQAYQAMVGVSEDSNNPNKTLLDVQVRAGVPKILEPFLGISHFYST